MSNDSTKTPNLSKIEQVHVELINLRQWYNYTASAENCVDDIDVLGRVVLLMDELSIKLRRLRDETDGLITRRQSAEFYDRCRKITEPEVDPLDTVCDCGGVYHPYERRPYGAWKCDLCGNTCLPTRRWVLDF